MGWIRSKPNSIEKSTGSGAFFVAAEIRKAEFLPQF
jgi:hypothetical protein